MLIPGQPPLYKLKDKTALYTYQQLQIVSKDEKLPPSSIQRKFIVEKIDAKKIKGKMYYIGQMEKLF